MALAQARKDPAPSENVYFATVLGVGRLALNSVKLEKHLDRRRVALSTGRLTAYGNSPSWSRDRRGPPAFPRGAPPSRALGDSIESPRII